MTTAKVNSFVPKISENVPWETAHHITLLYQKINSIAQAVVSAHNEGANTTTTIERIIGGGSSGGSGGGSGGGGTPATIGFVNDQAGNTAYTTQPADNGAVIIMNDASPVVVTLGIAATTPWFCWITNLGVGTATLTPASGTINGGASLSLLQNSTAVVAFDGTNFWAAISPTVPIATSSTFGIVKPDNTTITIAGGVISSTGGGGGGPTVTTNANGTCVDFSGAWVHQFGTAGPSATGVARTSFFVTFPVTFANVPVVVCEPANDPDAYGTSVFSSYPSGISIFGFTANLTCGTTIGGGGPANITVATYVNWMADYA